jgi:hypothetical protein
MHSLIYWLLIILVGANTLCLSGFYYAKIVYNKKFNPLTMHYFSVALVVSFLVYLLMALFFSVFYLMNGNIIWGLFFLAALVNPFVIGILGNNYNKADRYYSTQIFFFALSLFFFIFKVV